MPSLLLRLSLVFRLLHGVLSFLPKRIRSFFAAPLFHTTIKDLPAKSASTATRPIDRSELRRVFETFDRDGDGSITKQEMQDSLDNLGIFIADADLAAMIARIDVNGDGCVDLDEFGALYETIAGGKGEKDEEEEEEDLREVFGVFDANGDGYISVEELGAVVGALGLRRGSKAEELRGMIGRVDEDGDGRVSFGEFKRMMRSGDAPAFVGVS